MMHVTWALGALVPRASPNLPFPPSLANLLSSDALSIDSIRQRRKHRDNPRFDICISSTPEKKNTQPPRHRAVAKMSGLDVEALLDSTASSKDQTSKAAANGDSPQNGSRSERDHDRRSRDRSREGDRDRGRRHRDRSSGRNTPRSDAGSHKSRRRSRSRDSGRHSRRHRTDGDYYRGGRGARGGRSRSRSPNRYRPHGDDRRDRDRDRDDRGYRRREDDRRGARQSTPRDPSPTGDERDRRTVFVQQLAARLRTRELKEFFEKVGAVAEAQIVKDRVSNRSKG